MMREPIVGAMLAMVLVMGSAGASGDGAGTAQSHGDKKNVVAGGKAAHGAHWGYEGAVGPEVWGDLGYAECKSGGNQSPINLAGAMVTELDPLTFNYHPFPLKVTNNGHTVQVNAGAGNTLTVGGRRYDLLQFHVHTPSEHQINGESYPMEWHLVHKNSAGRLAVVGVLFQLGAENAALAQLGELPRGAGEATKGATPFNPADLLPTDLSTFHYMGSLTTPPCSEGVAWFPLRTPVTVSEAQLAAFTEILHGNARPVQPLNSRHLLLNQ